MRVYGTFSFSIIPVTFISIAIYAFRWNEWMWGLKALPWVKCEFWWSIIAAITTGVGFIIILASTLSNFDNTAVESEGIASSLICYFGKQGRSSFRAIFASHFFGSLFGPVLDSKTHPACRYESDQLLTT